MNENTAQFLFECLTCVKGGTLDCGKASLSLHGARTVGYPYIENGT